MGYAILLGISIFVVTSSKVASAGEQKDYLKISNEISDLLEVGKFDEALALIRGKKSLCLGYNEQGSCYRGEKADAEAELTVQIDFARKCYNAFQGATEKALPETREAAKALKAQIATACTPPDNSMPGTWEIKVPLAYGPKIDQITKSLNEIERTGRFSEATADGSANALAMAKNRCVEGMKWGYALKDNTVAKHAGKLGDELRGEFKTKDECEEARLTDPNAGPNLKMVGGVSCTQRYLGEPQIVKLATISYMYKGNNYGDMGKAQIFFSSSAACQASKGKGADVDNGVDPRSPNHHVMHLNPAGSTALPRLIGDCTESEQLICKPLDFKVNSVQPVN